MKISTAYFHSLVISLAFFTGSCMANENNQTSQPKFILYAEAITKQGSAEIRVNDIPIGSTSQTGLFSRMIEDYLLPEENTLSIHSKGNNSIVKARIAAYKEGEFIDGKTGRTFIHTHITSENTTNSVSGELASDRKHWSWLGNQTLTEKNKEEAMEAVKNIYQDLAKADIPKLIAVLDPWLTEIGSTYSKITKEQRTEDLSKRIQKLKLTELWSFDDIQSINIKLVPVANGKLYDVRRGNGSPLFRTNQKTNNEWFTIGNLIGKKNNVWQIYR